MGGLVVEGALVQQVPEQLEPAVGKGAQRLVVRLAAGALGVVELTCPGAAPEAAEGPLHGRLAQVSVAGESAGDGQLLARASGHRGRAAVALQLVGDGELQGAVADLGQHPGGEADVESGQAQVDLAVRVRRFQELLQAPLPRPPLAVDEEQLLGREAESTRVMAVLHFVDGLTHEEVGREVGLTAEGVRKRLRGLRARVAAQMGEGAAPEVIP